MPHSHSLPLPRTFTFETSALPVQTHPWDSSRHHDRRGWWWSSWRVLPPDVRTTQQNCTAVKISMSGIDNSSTSTRRPRDNHRLWEPGEGILRHEGVGSHFSSALIRHDGDKENMPSAKDQAALPRALPTPQIPSCFIYSRPQKRFERPAVPLSSPGLACSTLCFSRQAIQSVLNHVRPWSGGNVSFRRRRIVVFGFKTAAVQCPGEEIYINVLLSKIE